MPRPRHEPGVPVAQLAAQAHCVGVGFHCQACAHTRRVAWAALLPRLRALGLDPETTGVRDLWRHARRPCDQCGGLDFETRPAWRGLPGADGTAA
ncbi:MAG: hypothetical protein Q8J89_05095 [Caulobacter sp.]|nr:hypothetical protein [Caulobacter sp.]